jgi:hypothetical protein
LYVFIALVLASSPATADVERPDPTLTTLTPKQQFEQGREAFRAGQYAKARGLFNDLVYPPPPKIASAQELLEVYIDLGVSRFETGDAPGAKREFEQALRIDPAFRMDPMIVSDPDAIRVFNETRLDIAGALKAEADAKKRADLLLLRQSMVGIENHVRYLNFVPFGAGQYQNGDTAKGLFFSITEGAMLATSVGIYGYLISTYGIRSTHVPLSDGSNVRFLQQVEIGSGALFIGLAIYGIVDATRHYKPTVRTDIDESLLPPELRGLLKQDKPKAKPPKTSFRILPMITPDGAGIGLSWEH